MTYKEAKRAYKRVGTANATGDACAAIYAEVVRMACCLGKSAIVPLYEHLRQLGTDTQIHNEGQRLILNPFECFDIIW